MATFSDCAPVPDHLTLRQLSDLTREWYGPTADPLPLDLTWFSRRWNNREVRWVLGADGLFHVERDVKEPA